MRQSGRGCAWSGYKGMTRKKLSGGVRSIWFLLFTVTAARQREFNMSVPWWEYSQLLLSRKDRPLRTAADTVGKRIAVRDLQAAVAQAQWCCREPFSLPR